MLGDIQDLCSREEVSEELLQFVPYVVDPVVKICTLSVHAGEATERVQLARKEAEDFCSARLCV